MKRFAVAGLLALSGAGVGALDLATVQGGRHRLLACLEAGWWPPAAALTVTQARSLYAGPQVQLWPALKLPSHDFQLVAAFDADGASAVLLLHGGIAGTTQVYGPAVAADPCPAGGRPSSTFTHDPIPR